jgi:small subunit ribosomal protein S12
MSRISQLIKNPRRKKFIKVRSPRLQANPQKKVVCLRLLTMSPKKPNSANRRIAKVNVTAFDKRLTIKIPGETHNLQQHSTILIRGGRVRDLIGVRYLGIRGKYDLSGVKNRKTSRSLYGVKRGLVF